MQLQQHQRVNVLQSNVQLPGEALKTIHTHSRSAALKWRVQGGGLQLTGAGCTWRGCQWPRAVGLSFSAQSDLDYLSGSYLSHLKWEEKFLQWESLWGAKGRETLPGRTSRAGERQGLRRTDVSSAWEAAVWGNSGVGCCWARSLGFGMKLEASSTIVEGARIKGFKRSL